MYAYTPYDGSARPFSIGLRPLDVEEWIEPDAAFVAHMAEKDRLFAAEGEAVFRADPLTRDAQAEVVGLLFDYLPRRHPTLYRAMPDGGITLIATGASYRPDDCSDAPLHVAARLVQEDLCLMRRGDDGYRLAAAALCFPSSWSLAEKFGRPMDAIHAPVPGYGDRLGPRINRIFDNLSVEQPVWRINWSVYDTPDLYHPTAKRLHGNARPDGSGLLGNLFIRVERQTLRRLHVSGDILFTIKVYHDPLEGLSSHPEGAALAAGLREQLLALDDDQLDYKGLVEHRDAFAAALSEIAGTA